MISSFKAKLLSLPVMIIIITFTAIFVWNLSANNDHVLCIKDCGEGFIAQHQVQNFRLYGFKHLLVEDHATSNDETQHTYFYTHNVNIGAISYQLLDYIGIKSFTGKQLFTLFIFSLSMCYVYLAINYYTGSKLIAFFTLLFSITDINQVLAFSLNPLRAWHWLAIFGIIYHVTKYTRSITPSWLNKLAILLFLSTAFGIGYEFFGICVVLALVTVIANTKIISKDILNKVGLILALATIPFVLRQIQVAYVLGLHYWLQDFFYSFVIKIPYIVKFFPLDFDEINNFYASYNVLRPPASASGSVTFAMNCDLFIRLVKSVMLNESGHISIIIACLVCIATIILVLNKKLKLKYINNSQKHEFYQSSVLLLILGSSILIGLTLFLPFSLHVYFKHQFPLVAVPLHFAKAIFIVYLIYITKNMIMKRWIKVSLLSACIFIMADHTLIHIVNADKDNKMETDWTEILMNDPDATYAVSWIPSTAAGYTKNWVVGIKPGAERIIAENFNSNRALFSQDELFLFGQKTNGNINKFLQPDYWLYFQSDNTNPFDFPSLQLPKDYLIKLIYTILPKKIYMTHPWVSKSEVNVNEIITFGGHLHAKGINVKKIIVQDSMMNSLNSFDSSLAPFESNYIKYNTNTGMIYGEYTIPNTYTVFSATDDANINIMKLYFIAVLEDDTQRVIMEQPIRINMNINLTNKKLAYLRQQPSVSQLIESMPNLPIKSQGKKYVIFDLRGLKSVDR